MRAGRRSILIAVLSLMVVVGLPVGDVHADGDAGSGTSEAAFAEPAHADHSLPTTEDEHVHLHHCCPHAISTTDLQVTLVWPHVSYTPTVNAGNLLPGVLTLPFRPPAA
jgi:hypothetical protein